MKQYISIFKVKFINNLQYRAAALAGISAQFFFGFVFVMVYIAFYASNNTTNAPMELSQVVSYLWLNQAFFSLVYMWYKDKELLGMIRNGNIAYELCRPLNFYLKWYSTLYGSRLAAVLLRFAPVLIMAFFLPAPYNLSLPNGMFAFILFWVSLFLSSILVTAITLIFHLITFFTLDEKGILSLMMVIAEIFEGGLVPLAFYPKFLQMISYLLPFRYVCDLPFRIYSGSISITSAIPNLIGTIIWIFIAIYIGILISKRALKKAIIQGG